VSKKQKIIIGNWKMNPGTREKAVAVLSGVIDRAGKYKNVEAVLCPPYVYLEACSDVIKKKSRSKKSGTVRLGAQNLFYEPEGAYTGEVSGSLITQFGATHVIIGHSERRKLGETDEVINKKVMLALKLKLKAVICVGETSRDEEGSYLATIKEQVAKAVANVPRQSLSKIIIAYEPVWAIGAASAMGPHEVHEMTIFIRKCLVELYKIRMIPTAILYGGSVDPLNAGSILAGGEADGLLVGRQSLEAESFGEILRSADSV
jgi:triosephosphate isomerase